MPRIVTTGTRKGSSTGTTPASPQGPLPLPSGGLLNNFRQVVAACVEEVLSVLRAGQELLQESDRAVLAAAAGPLEAEAFTPVLTFDRTKRMTATATLGKVIIGRAPSGHVPGSQILILIPANTVSDAVDLKISEEFAITDHPLFTPVDTWALIVTCLTETSFISSLVKVPPHDSTAPILSSATVNVGTNPNALVLLFNSAVILPNLVGSSLTFESGTPRTITAIEAISDDLTTWTLTLSGNFDGSEVCSIVRGSAWQDLSGNLIAAGSTSVSLVGNFTLSDLPNKTLWIDPGAGHATVEGGGVATVANQGSVVGDFTQGTPGARPTYNAAGFGPGLPWFDYDGTADYLGSTLTFDDLVTDPGEWYFVAVVTIDAISTDAANDANNAIMSESAGYWSPCFRSSSGFVQYVWDVGAKVPGAALPGAPPQKVLVESEATGGTLRVRVNKGSWTTIAAGDVGQVNGTLKIGANRTATIFGNLKHGDIVLTNGSPGLSIMNSTADFLMAKYGI